MQSLVLAGAMAWTGTAACGDDAWPEWWRDRSGARAMDGPADPGPILIEEAVRPRESRTEPDPAEIARIVGQRSSSAGSRYGMQPGDLLDIRVWREPELSTQVQVSPDGWIAVPLVGEVAVAGLTVEEVRTELAARLVDLVANAVVTVTIAEIRGNRVFVVGKVNRPGAYAFIEPIDVMQALTLAGGTARFAGQEDIRILRREGDGQHAFDFDYDDVARGRNLEQNILLRSGDVVLVP